MKEAVFYYRDPTAPKPNGPLHIGTSIFIEYQEKCLLDHRQDNDSWALVGGGLDMEETFLQGIKREVWEETGIRLSDEEISFYDIYDDPSRIACYPDGNILRIITVVYRARLAQLPELVCSAESRELRFFTKEEITRLSITETHWPIVADYLKRG